MSGIFLALAVISGGVALGGTIWSVAARLRSRREVALAAEAPQKDTIPGTDSDTTKNTAAAARIGNGSLGELRGYSVAAIGRQVREAGSRHALPGLLTAGGVLAALVFISLALLTSLPSKLFGLAALGIAVYVAIAELRSLRREPRD